MLVAALLDLGVPVAARTRTHIILSKAVDRQACQARRKQGARHTAVHAKLPPDGKRKRPRPVDPDYPPPPPLRRGQPREIAPKIIRSNPLPGAPLAGGGDKLNQVAPTEPVSDFDRLLALASNSFASILPGFAKANDAEKEQYLKKLERADMKARAMGYGEWGADVELGDDWEFKPREEQLDEKPDPRSRYAGTDTPRDAWLRPIVDVQGVFDRLSFDRKSTEQRLYEESRLNTTESREALGFAGVWLFLIPFGLGYLISRGIAEPVIVYLHDTNPDYLELSARNKLEGAKKIKSEELRIRLESAIGKAPPISDADKFHHLHEVALEFQHEKKEEIRTGLVNVISDSITITAFLTILIMRKSGRRVLWSALGRFTQGVSQTGKAFIIILVADILMGYHSEEGWTAAIELLSEHYNAEISFPPIAIFVSTVPVLLDTLFKYWLFKNLNRTDPSASVTLKEMDRH